MIQLVVLYSVIFLLLCVGELRRLVQRAEVADAEKDELKRELDMSNKKVGILILLALKL